MLLVSLKNISLSYSTAPVLDNTDFHIKSGQHICLIGSNGSGKSSLLKLITGLETPDHGTITYHPNSKTAYLSQDIPDTIPGSVFDIVSDGREEEKAILEKFHTLSEQVSKQPSESLIAALDDIQEKISFHNIWAWMSNVDNILNHLTLKASDKYDTLSGGQKRRVLLAKTLVSSANLILLDEPTNHLDIQTIVWLENYIKNLDKTIVFVSHDREFSHNVANSMAEIDRGKLYHLPSTYNDFLKKRDNRLHSEKQHWQLFDKKLAKEEEWIRQGIQARRTRNEGRVRSLMSMRDVREKRRTLNKSLKARVNEAELSGKLILHAENANFAFDDSAPLIRDFTSFILRGDKVGILGPNGCGKTTLLKLMLGKLQATSGHITLGKGLKIAYFDQMRTIIDGEKTVKQVISPEGDMFTIDGKPKHVLGYLNEFLFSPDRAVCPVKVLSGGEKNRLMLAKLFLQPANLLVLDEPTNDLDIDTLELLEHMLIQYDGTAFIVSHDRSFLNNVMTSAFIFSPDHEIIQHTGNVDTWDSYFTNTTPKISMDNDNSDKTDTTIASKNKISQPPKLRYHEKCELEQLPDKIAHLESKKSELEAALIDPEIYVHGEKVATIQKKLSLITSELDQHMNRWLELESIGNT